MLTHSQEQPALSSSRLDWQSPFTAAQMVTRCTCRWADCGVCSSMLAVSLFHRLCTHGHTCSAYSRQPHMMRLLQHPDCSLLCASPQVACKQLVGLYLSIWARKRIARHIRGVQATSAATGWGGYLGNKGAVAVRLRVYDAPLLVVCSHLASGDARGDEQRRNSDAAEIMRRCVFENPDTQQGACHASCSSHACTALWSTCQPGTAARLADCVSAGDKA